MTPPPIPPLPPTPAPHAPSDSIVKGVLVAIVCDIVLLAATCAISFVGIFAFGLIQWIGLIPLYFYFRNRGDRLAAKGLLITGFIVFLLQAACYGLILMFGIGNMH